MTDENKPYIVRTYYVDYLEVGLNEPTIEGYEIVKIIKLLSYDLNTRVSVVAKKLASVSK